uniref:Hexosyltransferase n=1 Tax=Ciona intestinalis TaxID=7719 RepID=H2XVC8_CIOIN
FVKSLYLGIHKRNMIRSTWASVRYIEGCAFMTIFVMGNPLNDTKAAVKQEMLVHSDILQYDGPDDYRNITTKTLAGMHWATANLKSEDIYISADDDIVIDINKLQRAIQQFNETRAANLWPEFPIICGLRLMKGFLPHRFTKSKWFISIDKYKWPSYPNFCLGGMYATSISVVSQLLEIAQSTRPLHLDDVWITGILRLKLGLPDTITYRCPRISDHVSFVDPRIRRFYENENPTVIFVWFKSAHECTSFA